MEIGGLMRYDLSVCGGLQRCKVVAVSSLSQQGLSKTQGMRTLRRDARGVTLLEFGFVAPPLMLTIMAIGDLGYQAYWHAVARGVLEKAARAASVRHPPGFGTDR